jgi:hypothetical protein
VSGAEAVQPAAMGTYTKVAGLMQWDRPVYQRVGRPVYPYTPMLYLFYDYQYRCGKGGGVFSCYKEEIGRWLIGKDYTKFNNPAPETRPTDASDAAFKLVWSGGPGAGLAGPAQCPDFAEEWTVLSIHGGWDLGRKFPMTVSALRAGALQAESIVLTSVPRAPTCAHCAVCRALSE